MGVDAVVIVENSRDVSLDEFIRALSEDEWGSRTVYLWEEEPGWTEFEWEGKRYFSWVYAPRAWHLDLYGLNDETTTEVERGPDSENPVQVTFLKAMLAVERAAGGPIYVGNDLINFDTPEDAAAFQEEFFLPAALDWLIPRWREAEKLVVDDPVMFLNN